MAATVDELPRMSDLTGSIFRFNRWLGNFSGLMAGAIGSGPAGVALGSSSAGTPPSVPPTGILLVAALQTTWTTAYNLATNNATRNHQTILNLTQLRNGPVGEGGNPLQGVLGAVPGSNKGIVGVLRTLIRAIQAASEVNTGAAVIGAGILGQLGLTPRTKIRGVPLIPANGPEIWLDRSGPHVLRIRYAQEGMRETSKAKPRGCKSIKIVWQCANGSSGSGVFSKCPANLDVGAGNSGQRCRVTATWIMGNSKESPGGNVMEVGVP
jgi:hypothetical protein